MRCVRAITVTVGKQWVLHIVSVYLYPLVSSIKCACAILSSVAHSALKYFSTLRHRKHFFLKRVIEYKMCVLILSTTFIWKISHSKKTSARYNQKCILVFMYSTHYTCQNLTKLEFSHQNFEKNIFAYQVSWKSVHWKPRCTTRTNGRTDRETDRQTWLS